MKFPSLLFFSPFLILFSHGLHAFAPSDLTGYKIGLDITESSALSKGIRDFYFSSNVKAIQYSGENGQWYPDTTTWTPSASIASKLVIGEINSSYADVFLNFQNASSGTFTFSYYDSEDGSPIQKLDEGSGTFTLSTFQSSDIPYDYYFSDDFSDLSKSQKLWPITSVYGLTNQISAGKFMVTGTLNDLEARWYDVNANSILSLQNDWIIDGSLFTNIPSQNSLNYQSAIGLDAEGIENGFEIEISIGVHMGYVMTEIYISSFGSYSSQYKSTSREAMKEGNFRVFNLSSTKTLTSQYYKDSKWVSLYELNWETGLLTEKNTYSGNDTTHQFSNWQNLDNSMVAPMMDYAIPHIDKGNNQIEIVPLAEGDLGFTNFSVTAGAPEPDPEYTPSSLVGMIYRGSTNDDYQFIDQSNAIFYHEESNFQSSEVSGITYTWSPNGNSGTLTTSLDETTTLSFTSASEGTFQWQENGGSSKNGSFTLTDASTGYAPSSLSGDSMIAGTTTYVFKENGVVTIRSTTDSQDSTYSFVKSGNNEIVFSIPAYGNSQSSTLYKMTFSSTGAGTLSEGGSGSFQYFIDGNNQPSTKGWMWFDQYPWVYSHIEGGWLYFNASGSKLMVYSSKDKAWRDMVK